MEATQSTSWNDFDTLRHSIKSYTVDKLKSIIAGLNEECSCALPKTGKKQDLIERISGALNSFRPNQPDKWARARGVLCQVRQSGSYIPPSTSFASTSYATVPRFPPSTPVKTLPSSSHRLNSNALMNVSVFAPQRLPSQPSASTSQPASPASFKFKTSPFFRVDEIVSDVLTCPESTGQTDRRASNLKFQLTQPQINKLMQSSPKYQLRLYCTSSTFYMPGTFRSSGPCPIEFPATCEVRVNNSPLIANLKGVKKKPGTAPPADVTNLVRKAQGVGNALEMIYINSQPNTAPKKYYLAVNLVETTSVDQLVKRLQSKRKSHHDIKAQMLKSSKDDDEIVIGKQSMSLKCPLSFTRIKTPARSEKCVHPQCFDATSWFTVMEQTSTWLCPVCEHVLDPADLFVDGYFEQILEATHEDIDEVEVEPDGEWHTSDNKYASAGWLATVRAKAERKGKDVQPSVSSTPTVEANKPSGSISVAGAVVAPRSDSEIFVLDSDSDREDEGRVKRELSPAYRRPSNGFVRNGSSSSSSRPPAPARSAPVRTSIIDLTIDSDPDDSPHRPTYNAGKRKANEISLSDGGPDASKRPRESSAVTLTISRDTTNGYSVVPPTAGTNNHSISHSQPFNNTRTLPPPIPTRPTSSSGGLPSTFTTHLPMGSSSPRYSAGGGDRSPLMNGYLQSQQRSTPFAPVNGDSRRLPAPNPSYGYETYPRLNGSGSSSNSHGWPR